LRSYEKFKNIEEIPRIFNCRDQKKESLIYWYDFVACYVLNEEEGEEGGGDPKAKWWNLSQIYSPILGLFIYYAELFFVDNHKSTSTDARSNMHYAYMQSE
jgi:hypothetical protein